MDLKEVIHLFKPNRDFKIPLNYLQSNLDGLQALIEMIITEKEYPYPEYASWILTHFVKIENSSVKPFQKELIDFILSPSSNQTLLRNVVNVLVQLKIDEYKESELLDRLMEFVKNGENKVALQVYSIQLFVQYIKKYPELKDELSSLVDLYTEGRTSAYHASVRDFHKKVKKIK